MEILSFTTPRAFRTWLGRNHGQVDGLWLRIFKKDAGVKTITYAEALDQALCHGWIDGQKKTHDERSWLQKFTPRGSRSTWSKRNTKHVARLIRSGRMTRAGMEAVRAAKADGRWQNAYDSPRNAPPPGDFLAALDKNRPAKAFFETLNRANVYAIVYRLQTARRPETRARRMKAILEMLARGEKFHP